jgi:predicted ester cyclase
MHSSNRNRDIILDLYRRIEASDFERARELVSPSCRTHIGGNVLDLESWVAMGQMFMAAFPDGRHVWDLADAAGDYVVLNGYFTGTQQQPFQGLPATGRTVKFSATFVDKLIDGKLVEHRGDFDTAALMQQLSG